MERSELRSPAGGANQHGVRDHNERLILSMIQRHGAVPGSDLARMAGLSPQTVSVILRKLEQDGFVMRGDPQRGRVGKPSIPMALAPGAVFSIGLKIGRRSADLVLMDFRGTVRLGRQTTYRYPMPDAILTFLRDGIAGFRQSLPPDSRFAGIGVAQPFEIWNWHDTIGAPAADLEAWRGFDIAGAIAGFSDLPVHVENDATAACRAEQVYGCGHDYRDFAYFFVGAFIGGGVVLNHSVFDGLHGNAAAFGSLPVRDARGRDCQLIDVASLHLLEARLAAAGINPERLWSQPQDWCAFTRHAEAWIAEAAPQVARAALTICAVIDFEAIVVDGAFPEDMRDRFVARIAAELAALDARGVQVPAIVAGRIGGNARALGAACGPVFARYLLNTHALMSSG